MILLCDPHLYPLHQQVPSCLPEILPSASPASSVFTTTTTIPCVDYFPLPAPSFHSAPFDHSSQLPEDRSYYSSDKNLPCVPLIFRISSRLHTHTWDIPQGLAKTSPWVSLQTYCAPFPVVYFAPVTLTFKRAMTHVLQMLLPYLDGSPPLLWILSSF